MTSYFQGKTVLITGASSGLGAALASSLAQLGANLLLVARNTDALNTLKTELAAKTKVDVYGLDISDEPAVEQFASGMDLSQIDILINNAGIFCCDHMENLSSADYRSMIETNYLGQLWITRALLPELKAKKSAQIVNVASMAGAIGIAGYTAYSPSKFAMVGFTESLRNELAGTGVKVMLVLPSDMDTPQFHQENQTKPAVTKALSGTIKPISAGNAASRILKAVERRKTELVISPLSGHILLWLYRAFPSISRTLIDQKIKNVSKPS